MRLAMISAGRRKKRIARRRLRTHLGGMSYRVLPIPPETSVAVRQTRLAPGYGHPVHASTATSYGPCRSCLATFRVGAERRLLFTLDAFEGLDSYPSPGPVFIHEEPCEPWAAEGFPPEVRDLPLVLEGYGRGRHLVARERASGARVEEALERLFAEPAVEYLHVRNAQAGCYIARVERTATPPA